MVLEIDVGVFVTVAVAVVGAWWGMAKLFVSQFEARMTERLTDLQSSIINQEKALEGHLTKQDMSNTSLLSEIRRVENELGKCRVDAAEKYQTKAETSHQFGQVLVEIRALSARIDAIHGRGTGLSQ